MASHDLVIKLANAIVSRIVPLYTIQFPITSKSELGSREGKTSFRIHPGNVLSPSRHYQPHTKSPVVSFWCAQPDTTSGPNVFLIRSRVPTVTVTAASLEFVENTPQSDNCVGTTGGWRFRTDITSDRPTKEVQKSQLGCSSLHTRRSQGLKLDECWRV